MNRIFLLKIIKGLLVFISLSVVNFVRLKKSLHASNWKSPANDVSFFTLTNNFPQHCLDSSVPMNHATIKL